jgi:CheY-like chemotaxis protein
MDLRLSAAMDGLEAARQIQEKTRIPVVYLTGVFLRDPSKMQPPGLCVTKPFLISDLRHAIDLALRPANTSFERATN